MANGGLTRLQIFIDDLREEFVRDYVFPMFRANCLYEGTYMLGTSIARPLIAKRQIEIAKETGADAVSHGATGKGNDQARARHSGKSSGAAACSQHRSGQVRFELGYYALKPDIRVIAPWREWSLTSRTSMIEYAEKNGIPVEAKKRNAPPYSTRPPALIPAVWQSAGRSAASPCRHGRQPAAHQLRGQRAGGPLDSGAGGHVPPLCVPGTGARPGAACCELAVRGERDVRAQAPDKATIVEVEFEHGDAVAIDGVRLSPAALLTKCVPALAHAHARV